MSPNQITSTCQAMLQHCQTITRSEDEDRRLLRVHFQVSETLTSCAGRARDTGLVEISRPIFAKTPSMAQLVDTILHEIAHVVAGCDHGHGIEWQRVALRLGCSANRCHNMPPAPRRVALTLEDLGL